MSPFLLRYIPIILFALLVLAFLVMGAIVVGRFFYSLSEKRAKKRKARKSGQLPADAGVRDLIAEGKLDQARDLYQQFTGVDMFTAQEAVEEMAREFRLTMIDDEVLMTLSNKGKAAAIQRYQEDTDADFDAALKHIEQLEKARK
ncbi:MAG: hypothetical protein AAFV98_01230 [Chloroflexota bacterium]